MSDEKDPKELTHQQKLEAVLARTQAAEKRRKIQAEQVELADAELEAAATEALADIEAQHGEHAHTRVTMVKTQNQFVILQRGPEVLFMNFRATVEKLEKQNKNVPDSVYLNYVRPHVVHPDKVAFEKLAAELPIAVFYLATKCSELYGLKPDEDQKK